MTLNLPLHFGLTLPFGRFPADDVGARNNLQRWLNLPEKLNYETTRQAIHAWEEYGGLVYFHLLLKSLSEKEIIAQ